jgi:hypothetical protein
MIFLLNIFNIDVRMTKVGRWVYVHALASTA